MEQHSQLSNLVPILLRNGQLYWYPPGAGDEPQPLDNEIAREQLKSAAAGRAANICFAVPGTDVRLVTMDISADEKKHISKSLPFMLEEEVGQDVESLHFASLAVGKLGLSVAVCEKDRMLDWQAQLQGLGSITRWLPEPLLLPWQQDQWTVVIEGPLAIVRLTLTDGFSIETSLLPLLLEQALSDGNRPDAVVVYGQDQQADTAVLPESLREQVQWRRGGMGAAIMLSDSVDQAVNLRQGEFAARLPLGRWWLQWRVAAAVFAAAFVLQLLASWADYQNLQEQNLQLRVAINDSYRRANPRGNVPEPEKQLRRQLDTIRGNATSGGFVALMEQVGAVIAARPGTSIASVNYNDKGGEIRMNIIAADFEAVEAIRAGINAAGLNAEMESSNAQGGEVRARIRVGERS
jgi:general secretion pathway protein L